MHTTTQRVIERMGRFFERDGLPRIAGRLLGYLLLSPEPRTLDDLAHTLQISKSSASTNARLLERVGTVQRVTVPGDRRDYYQIAPDATERLGALWLERLVGTRALLEEALGTPAAAEEPVRRRLRKGVRLMETLASAVESAEGAAQEGSADGGEGGSEAGSETGSETGSGATMDDRGAR